MSTAFASARPNANLATGQLAGRSPLRAAAEQAIADVTGISSDRPLGRLDGLREVFRRIWPAKTSLEFHIRTGASVRHAERVLGGQRGLSIEALHALLWSDAGLPVLREVMRGCREQWWLDLERTLEIAELERRLAAARREHEAITSL